jgi:arylsulfatase A-like enzyme
MTRRSPFAEILPLLLALSLSCALEPRPAPKPEPVPEPVDPNIILIVVDTLRPDHMSTYGYERETTPHISALAEDGVLFRNASSTAPWTLPSVASVLTGQYPSTLGIRGELARLDERFESLPEVLHRRGYRTLGAVSHTLLSSRLGFGRGFDTYAEPRSFSQAGSSSGRTTDMAMQLIQQAPADRPFFLFLHYFDPHYEYELHPDHQYIEGYQGRVMNGHPILELWPILKELDPEDLRYLMSLYDSEIAHTDEHIGRLLTKLRELDLYEDALIVFTADHGEEFMERGWVGHSISLHREQLWVPLVIKPPGGQSREVERRVSLVDVVPTLYQALGIELPAGLAGQPLPLDGQSTSVTPPIYSETFNRQEMRPNAPARLALRSVVLGDLKLIANEVTDRVELFDLSIDPEERFNLAGDRPEETTRLRALLLQWVEHMERKRGAGAAPPAHDLLTPEQRQQLEALGYLPPG